MGVTPICRCSLLKRKVYFALLISTMSFLYPPKPEASDLSFLDPSPQFKKQVYSMIQGIVGFALLYLGLVVVGIVLLVVCYYVSIGIISISPNFLTLAAGLGLLTLGVMFLIFLVKFIFSKTTETDPNQIEIFEKDYPTLFAFIRKVTEEVKTDFPKRIFLIPDVNAAVFYNSSFFSMFFPVRKNLKIGLGLVNSLTLSEFKGALAHEFGHFSQQSMALGSYVYTVNKVIFNLVNQRDRWDRMLERWANTGGVFGFFAGITYWMVNQVRTLLHLFYTKLNIRYMALSREMEYHADLVACSVAGNKPLISTLRRIEFTDQSYHYVLNSLNQLAGKKKKVTNIYTAHRMATAFLAKQFELATINDMPDITTEDLEKNLVKSRLNIKDQWASHPSREERELNINTVNLPVNTLDESAWSLFENAAACQQQVTAHLYTLGLPDHSEMEVLSEGEFINYLEEEDKKNEHPPIFKGFYDSRYLHEFNTDEAIQHTTDRAFEELFHESSKEFFDRQASNKNDLAQLKFIQGTIGKDEFIEFDYKKRKASEIPTIINELEKEVEEGRETGRKLEMHAFQYFYARANKEGTGSQFISAYNQVFEWQRKTITCGDLVERLQKLHEELNTKLHWTEQEGNQLNRTLNNLEGEFKPFLKTIPPYAISTLISNPEEFDQYVEGKVYYMLTSTFSNEGLEKLTGRIFEVFDLLHQKRFDALKEVVQMQLRYVPVQRV